jgi:hypothetical protein
MVATRKRKPGFYYKKKKKSENAQSEKLIN